MRFLTNCEETISISWLLGSFFFNLVVAIILGLDIFNKDEAYYTVIGFVGFLAGVFIIMEISKFLYERAEESIEEGKGIMFSDKIKTATYIS